MDNIIMCAVIAILTVVMIYYIIKVVPYEREVKVMSYTGFNFKIDSENIKKAINSIVKGETCRVEIGNYVKVYKVQSNNPNKYTIRIDIKEDI